MGLSLFIIDYQLEEIRRISSAAYRAFAYLMAKAFLSLLIILDARDPFGARNETIIRARVPTVSQKPFFAVPGRNEKGQPLG